MADSKVRLEIEEGLVSLSDDIGFVCDALSSEDEDWREQAEDTVTVLLMSAWRLWKILGKPESIRYPVCFDKGRSFNPVQNRITPSTTTYLAPISEIFDHILPEGSD